MAGRRATSVLTVMRLLAVPARRLAHVWRRSIQARVVIGTLTLSAVLAMFAGWVLLRQVTDGLLLSKQQSALTQAAAGVNTAQAKLTAGDPAELVDIGPVLNQLIEVLSPRDQARGDYGVVIIGPLVGSPAANGGSRASGQINAATSIPQPLLDRVRTHAGQFYVYTTVHFDKPRPASGPGIVVGSQLRVMTSGQTFGLFYVFPLQEQQQTLFVVRGALITTGSLLVVLLGTIAWLLTRQVVTPVRLARRIAERLAAGRLEERMRVRGEDDIARLGISFNQMARNLQRQIRQLEELSRVQRRFVADVSHELRTPLTTVRMAADLLHDGRSGFDPATARAAELLQNELDRFEGLLSDLLEISRFDAGAAVLELAEVDLRDVARRVSDAAGALSQRRGSRLQVLVGAAPCLVEADPRRLERIVRNLVVNAIEYGEGRDVEIRVARDDSSVALSVRDHGVGLKQGEDLMVFNRFWRADPARARTRGGTGLGLSIAVEDTTLHGGRLDAWGEPGRGSVFRLTLPPRPGDQMGRPPLPLVPDAVPVTTVGAPYARLQPGPPGGNP